VEVVDVVDELVEVVLGIKFDVGVVVVVVLGTVVVDDVEVVVVGAVVVVSTGNGARVV